MNLATAIAIAAEGFKNKTDKAGKPYILHCLRVMFNLNSDDDEINSVAVMHDCVEDNVCTIDDLVKAGFTYSVINSINLLTHDKNIPYQDYIKALANNEMARKVKLADLKDNSDITRLKGLNKKDFDRMEKYHIAYTYLQNI